LLGCPTFSKRVNSKCKSSIIVSKSGPEIGASFSQPNDLPIIPATYTSKRHHDDIMIQNEVSILNTGNAHQA